MIEPDVHVAFAPRGAGLMCAMFWFEHDDDVYGWYCGARGHEWIAAYFALDHYHSDIGTVSYRSARSDVYGEWLRVDARGESEIDPPVPVPEPLCHELDRLQDAFVREWLLFGDEPGHDAEKAALRAHDLPVLAANVRPGKINKLATGAPVWTFSSPNADVNIPAFLARTWPLDYKGR